ncbi:MAG: hypothetical protein ACRD1Q_09140 [Vicinamibacterales bacterium]
MGERQRMSAADLGGNLLMRLRKVLDVRSEWFDGEPRGITWRLWGAQQRAWLDTTTTRDGVLTRRLQLRTSALEWFPGSLAQLSELSVELSLPTIAGLVRRVDQPSRLELATSLEVREDTVEWILEVLPIASRMQAAEARVLSQSKALGRVGLIPEVDLEAKAPAVLPSRRRSLLPNALVPRLAGPCLEDSEIAECAEVLQAQLRAHAVKTPHGFHATFRLRSVDAGRSILEVTADSKDPAFGKGLLVVLSTPVRGGPQTAMLLNESEVSLLGRGHALGGWWAPKGGLLHHCMFIPDAIYRKGVTLHLLLVYARRADDAAELITGRH